MFTPKPGRTSVQKGSASSGAWAKLPSDKLNAIIRTMSILIVVEKSLTPS